MTRHITTALGYLAASTAIVLGTILLIAYGNGYSYDFSAGHLVRSGLVILQSTPSGGKLTIDGKLITQTTPYRKTFKAGVHDFLITKGGYRSWHKKIIVAPSGVSLTQYVILLPEHLEVGDLATFSHIASSVPSVDHKRLALNVTGGAGEGVWLYDVGPSSQTKLFTPKPATDTTPAESVTAVSWSLDSSHVLITTTNTQKIQYYVVAVNGNAAVINATDSLGSNVSSVMFNPANWRELYANSPDGLRRLDVTTLALSQVLAEHVISFGFTSDRVIYVDSSKPVRSLWLLDRAGHHQEVADRLPEGQSYGLDYSNLFNTPEIALVAQPAGTTVIYHDVLAAKPTVQAVPLTGDTVSFNQDGHYLLVWSATSLASYDVERNLNNIFPIPAGGVTGVGWFDNYHVVFDQASQTTLADFDGTNLQDITKASSVAATSSDDEKSALVVGITSTGASQLRTIPLRK